MTKKYHPYWVWVLSESTVRNITLITGDINILVKGADKYVTNCTALLHEYNYISGINEYVRRVPGLRGSSYMDHIFIKTIDGTSCLYLVV